MVLITFYFLIEFGLYIFLSLHLLVPDLAIGIRNYKHKANTQGYAGIFKVKSVSKERKALRHCDLMRVS